MLPPYLTDAEIDGLCEGYRQNAAKARFLRDTLKLRVERKPNGRPLVLRAELERVLVGGAPKSKCDPTSGPRWTKAVTPAAQGPSDLQAQPKGRTPRR